MVIVSDPSGCSDAWRRQSAGSNVEFEHDGISGGRIRANNRGVVFHP